MLDIKKLESFYQAADIVAGYDIRLAQVIEKMTMHDIVSYHAALKMRNSLCNYRCRYLTGDRAPAWKFVDFSSTIQDVVVAALNAFRLKFCAASEISFGYKTGLDSYGALYLLRRLQRETNYMRTCYTLNVI